MQLLNHYIVQCNENNVMLYGNYASIFKNFQTLRKKEKGNIKMKQIGTFRNN